MTQQGWRALIGCCLVGLLLWVAAFMAIGQAFGR